MVQQTRNAPVAVVLMEVQMAQHRICMMALLKLPLCFGSRSISTGATAAAAGCGHPHSVLNTGDLSWRPAAGRLGQRGSKLKLHSSSSCRALVQPDSTSPFARFEFATRAIDLHRSASPSAAAFGRFASHRGVILTYYSTYISTGPQAW